MKAKVGEPECRECGGLMEEREREEYGRLSFICCDCGLHTINPYLKMETVQPTKENDQ